MSAPRRIPERPPEVDRVLYSRATIASRVEEIGAALSDDLARTLEQERADPLRHADRVVLVPIMTGALVFTADLVRQMRLRLSMRLVMVSSYPGQSTQSKGAALKGALPDDLKGRHVVIIDDILDTGRTLTLVKGLIDEQNPASVRIVVLLNKPDRRTHDVEADYVGFEIPDEFVVGYGLDYNGYYRNLPDVVALRGDLLEG